jgi:hypothetical protein
MIAISATPAASAIRNSAAANFGGTALAHGCDARA